MDDDELEALQAIYDDMLEVQRDQRKVRLDSAYLTPSFTFSPSCSLFIFSSSPFLSAANHHLATAASQVVHRQGARCVYISDSTL